MVPRQIMKDYNPMVLNEQARNSTYMSTTYLYNMSLQLRERLTKTRFNSYMTIIYSLHQKILDTLRSFVYRGRYRFCFINLVILKQS